jgi:transposase
LKSKILAACAEPGASVAGVALAHSINANLVHRWRREAEGRDGGRQAKGELAEFVPLAISAAPVVAVSEEIRIELRRGACVVSIAWPISAAAACGGWLRELLR